MNANSRSDGHFCVTCDGGAVLAFNWSGHNRLRPAKRPRNAFNALRLSRFHL